MYIENRSLFFLKKEYISIGIEQEQMVLMLISTGVISINN